MPVQSCTGVDANISTWGQCLQDTVFFGDPTVAAIVILGFYAVFIYNQKIPGVLALPTGALIALALYLNGASNFLIPYAIAFILVLSWITLVLIQRFQLR